MSASEVLRSEIFEQPDAWRRVISDQREIESAAAAIKSLNPTLVRIAAHGTSGNAALYASYILRLMCGYTVVRDSVAMPLYYGVPAAAPGELAIGISQSGETPDIVAWLGQAAREGATTLAITNAANSPLSAVADYTIELQVGEELSVAASKTYSGTLASLALLAAHIAGSSESISSEMSTVADIAESSLPGWEAAVAPIASGLRGLTRIYLVARGIELATAHEIALKLTETCYIGAQAMSATAMAHGPVAAVDATMPVWLIAADDATLPAVLEAGRRAVDAGAEIIASGSAATSIVGSTYTLATAVESAPLLAPLLSVIPGQLFACSLAQAKNIDPGAPRNLRKVTSAS